MKVDLTEAAKGADVAKAPATGPHRKGDLVEREEPLTIRYVTPTGETKEAEVVSRVMGREDRDRLDRIVASNTGGIPLVCFPENGWRLRSEFRVALQLVEPPKWLLEAVGEDDALLGAIVGVLEAHSLRYFLGDDGEGGPVAIATHVEVRPHSQSLLAALGE
jgi:hypothetical protein